MSADESSDKDPNESNSDVIKPKIADPVVQSLLKTLKAISMMLTVDNVLKTKKGNNDLFQRVSDLVSYFVCCGLLDKFYEFFQCIQEPLEDTSVLMAYHTAIEMLQGIVAAMIR